MNNVILKIPQDIFYKIKKQVCDGCPRAVCRGGRKCPYELENYRSKNEIN